MADTAPAIAAAQASLVSRTTKLQGAEALQLIQAATAPQPPSAGGPPAVPVKVAPAEGSTVHVIA